ncbi:MAG: endonuclease/exonuclease/phosphatase family protein [Anaerolineae bacterium]|nr:endonuclease/exonuclease/phosphatase family protein [Anaerolineae bacterium]
MKHKQLVWAYGILFLFFLQLLSDFIESIYVFGLLSTGVTIEIISVVLLFSPVVLLVPHKGISKTMLLILAAGGLASRLIAVTLGPGAKMVVSGLGVGCWLVAFIVLLKELLALRPTIRQLGGSFTLTAGFMLVMILAQVFTTVYDYIPVIGPWFRDRFWFVFFLAGCGFTLPVLLLRKMDVYPDARSSQPQPDHILGVTVSVFAVISLIVVWGTVPTPNPPLAGENPKLRVLTYNIQQGYSEYGAKNFMGQLEVLQNAGADIIGLQESDTNRVAGGNADIVGYFARELNMHAYYGPKTVPGTFGIALLSKYPIESAKTFYMVSIGEQTAAIHARIQLSGHPVNVIITHLGNGGPMEQQQAILDYIQNLENVILIGDFNFRPDSEQYVLTTISLEDAWLVQENPAESGPELDPSRRIDHIFVTPGTPVMQSRYIVSSQSDHPALWADLTW